MATRKVKRIRRRYLVTNWNGGRLLEGRFRSVTSALVQAYKWSRRVNSPSMLYRDGTVLFVGYGR